MKNLRKSNLFTTCLAMLVSFSVIGFVGCENNDLFDTKEPFITTGEKKTTRISENSSEVLNLKKRLEKASVIDVSNEIAKEIKENNLRWDLAYRVTQGSMKGLFVPIEGSTEDNIKVLASLFIGGEMKEYILQKKQAEEQTKFTGEVNVYRANGKMFQQNIYKEGKLTNKPIANVIRLKSSPCETDDGTGTFDDYDDWFSADCDSQRFANNTGETIWYKPENGGTAKKLEPGEWTDEEIDGYSYRGQVHKVTDGYSTGAVTDSGFEADYSSLDYVGYLLIGGDLDESPGSGWDNLFSK